MDCEACSKVTPAAGTVCVAPLTDIPGKVIEYPGVVLDCTERHSMDIDGILLRYKFKTLIECSFPGRHLHGDGVIARTRCGILLRVGHVCASRSIEGWDEAHRKQGALIKAEIRRHRQLQREQEKRRAAAERTAREDEYIRDRPQQIRLAVQRINSEAASRGWPRWPLGEVTKLLDLTFDSDSFDRVYGTGLGARAKKLERLDWCEHHLARWQRAHLARREREGARMMRDG